MLIRELLIGEFTDVPFTYAPMYRFTNVRIYRFTNVPLISLGIAGEELFEGRSMSFRLQCRDVKM